MMTKNVKSFLLDVMTLVFDMVHGTNQLIFGSQMLGNI